MNHIPELAPALNRECDSSSYPKFADIVVTRGVIAVGNVFSNTTLATSLAEDLRTRKQCARNTAAFYIR
jgi:hypothetical protein